MEIGAQLAEFRTRVGASREEVAAACGVHGITVWKWERNGRPSGGNLLKLRAWILQAAIEHGIPIESVPRVEAFFDSVAA